MNEYFVNTGDTSEIIKEYTREAVREMIDQYPDQPIYADAHYDMFVLNTADLSD